MKKVLPFWIYKKMPVNHDEMQSTFLISMREKDCLAFGEDIYIKISAQTWAEKEDISKWEEQKFLWRLWVVLLNTAELA